MVPTDHIAKAISFPYNASDRPDDCFGKSANPSVLIARSLLASIFASVAARTYLIAGFSKCQIMRAAGREVWLGLQRKGDDFVWLNGATASYRNWNSNEPNNLTANEEFGDMLSNGRWNDAPNENPNSRGFICEWEF